MANRNPEIKYTKIFINNEFVDSVSGKTFPTENPCTGVKLAEVAEGDKADVDLAVAAARAAFTLGSEWRSLDASARGKLLHKFVDLMERDKNYLASLETLDNGMAFGLATRFVEFSIRSLRYMAGWADKFHGDTIPVDGSFMTFTRKEPVGVVGAILPWNVPIVMAAWKLGPALATGCTLIIKPAEQTPLTALYLASLLKEAGFPPGVINVVPGYGPTAGAGLAAHADVDKVAFTGSTEVGRLVMAQAAASNLKRVGLELGGKSPLIICADADLDMAATIAHEAANFNQGQACCNGTLTFVHTDVYDQFIQKSKELATKRVIGDPYEANCQQGPQIDRIQLDKIKELVESGKREGATLVCGGSQIGTKGYFFESTVFADVQDHMRIAKEEIFGPVQQVLKYDNFDEVIERANATNYGLAAGIISKDINKILTFVQRIHAGTVWVNTYNSFLAQAPFGGYKESGHGREQGEAVLAQYLETKTVTIALEEKH